jgi:hypothetical protein
MAGKGRLQDPAKEPSEPNEQEAVGAPTPVSYCICPKSNYDFSEVQHLA